MQGARSIIALVTALGLCYGAAAFGSLFTARSVSTWYTALERPTWTPPSWLFGPVWTVLYGMMAVAAWLVWRRHGVSGAAVPLSLFAAQLIFNAGWSAIFFGLRMPGAAFVEIVVLWCLIVATTATFWRVAPLAGYLMLPYLGWVTFASVLNYAIWRANA